jgi:hypothetical protein
MSEYKQAAVVAIDGVVVTAFIAVSGVLLARFGVRSI